MTEKQHTQRLEYGADEKEIGIHTPDNTNGTDALRTVDDGYDAEQIEPHYDQKEVQRILRKIDYRLIPLLGVLYLLAYIDRSNIGNAKIAGMYEDLELYGMRYNTALTVFFVPYALFEVWT
ncbi:hypothetical protein FOPE_00303 [Fonsecaea pedrosoi]|nr:hypothetical protein FOPE_00303 [Fonsecaea pedrosoi]